MFFKPLLIRSRIASRSCTLPSPRVIRPLRSRTVTPSNSREAIVSATESPPFGLIQVIAPLRCAASEQKQRREDHGSDSRLLPKRRCRGALGFFFGRCQMFDQRQFSSGLQLSKVYLIHERANEKDAAAGA